MNYTQNEKIEQITETTLVVGVDIGSRSHYARAFDWRGRELSKVLKFANCRDGFDRFHKWVVELQAAQKKDKAVVGAEPTGHYWFALRDYLEAASIQLVLVNPYHVRQSKEMDDNSQTKNDRKDPKVIAKLVTEGRYGVPYSPKGAYADLRIMSPMRQRTIEQLISCKNRLNRWFSIYFPEYEQVFGSFEAKSSIILLKKACMPADIVELGAEGVNRIWRDAKLRAVGMKRATTLINAAKASIGQREGSEAGRMEMELLLEEYEYHNAQYEKIMEKIQELCSKIPESKEMLAIKGIGLVTVAGFLAEVGDVRRFDSPKQIQKLAGFALKENSSGKHKGETTISKRGRARLRAILFKAVIPLIATNEEFRSIHEYYISRPEHPLKKKQSVVAVGCKLIRIFYAILTKEIVYDGQKMLEDIHRAPLVA